MAFAYPRRPSHFAHRFSRLMGKVCLGNEIGPEVCWLLSFIAHTEDAKGYRAPVTFFNEDLATRTGFSLAGMKRAREKAVRAGWLAYEPGAKGRAARYYVTVPREYVGVDDAPGDEDAGEFGPDIPAQAEPASGRNGAAGGGKVAQPEPTSGRNPDGIRTECEPHSSLSLPLALPQDPPTPPRGGGRGDTPAEVVRAWNESGLKRVLTPPGTCPPTLARVLRLRLGDPWWAANWRAGVARAAAAEKCRTGAGMNWPGATLDWFAKEDSLRRVLEGQFDDPKPAAKAREPPAAGGRNEPTHERLRRIAAEQQQRKAGA